MRAQLLVAAVLLAACNQASEQVDAGFVPDPDAAPAPDAPPARATDAATDAPPSIVAWYQDGSVTGTGSSNDFSALGVTADTITVDELATLIETNKYTMQPRLKTTAVDFDEVFLSRAQNSGFMGKLGVAVAQVRDDGWSKVLVYCNGPRSMSEAVVGGWSTIAQAGAMVGLEAYSTTFWPDVKDNMTTQFPFVDAADLPTIISMNPELYAAFQDLIRTYVTSAKLQVFDHTLFDHLTLLENENMTGDITAMEAISWSASKSMHAASLWYAALEAVAASEGIHFGIYHPA